MAITIVAKYRGRCQCGAIVLPGARVGYGNRRIVDCRACRAPFVPAPPAKPEEAPHERT